MDNNYNNGYNGQDFNNQAQNEQNDAQNYQQQYNQMYGQQNNQQGNDANYNQQQYAQPYNQQYNQQQYSQQPQPYGYTPQYQNADNEDGKSMAIASLVLGIVSFFCCGTICSILGLIFGIISKKRQPQNNGMATAGIVLSIIALILGLVVIILTALGEINLFQNSGYYSGYYY